MIRRNRLSASGPRCAWLAQIFEPSGPQPEVMGARVAAVADDLLGHVDDDGRWGGPDDVQRGDEPPDAITAAARSAVAPIAGGPPRGR